MAGQLLKTRKNQERRRAGSFDSISEDFLESEGDEGAGEEEGYLVSAFTFNLVTVFTVMIPLSITVFYP